MGAGVVSAGEKLGDAVLLDHIVRRTTATATRRWTGDDNVDDEDNEDYDNEDDYDDVNEDCDVNGNLKWARIERKPDKVKKNEQPQLHLPSVQN